MVAALVVAIALAAPNAAERAHALAERSIVEYDAGDFEKALADAQEAYEANPIPGILFNLGQCHRALRHWDKAEFFYKGYLRKKPDAKNRTAVVALIAEMEAKQKEQAAAAPTPGPILVEAGPTPTDDRTRGPVRSSASGLRGSDAPGPRNLADASASASAASTLSPAPAAAITESPSRPVPIGAWVTGSVGVAAIAVGAVFAVLATQLSGQDTKQPASGVWVHSLSQAQFANENTDAIAANSLIYGGAAVLVGGVLWGLLGRGSAAPEAASPTGGP